MTTQDDYGDWKAAMTIKREDMKHELLEKVRSVEPDWEPEVDDRDREAVEAKQAAIYELLAGELEKLHTQHKAALRVKEEAAQRLRDQAIELQEKVNALGKQRVSDAEALVKTLLHFWRLLGGRELKLNWVRQAPLKADGTPQIMLACAKEVNGSAPTYTFEPSIGVEVNPMDRRDPRTFELDSEGIASRDEAAFAIFVGAPLSRLTRSGELVPPQPEASSRQEEATPLPQGLTLRDVEQALQWWRAQKFDMVPVSLLNTLAGSCPRCAASTSRSA